MIGERLSKVLGQSVITENITGASGSVAARTVARATPDGHTLLVGNNTTHSANVSLLKSLSYDPVGDFAPVIKIGLVGLILAINNDLPIKDVLELIAYAKANPGKLSYGSGSGSTRFATEMFMEMAGANLVHVPYRTNNQALTDVMSGNIQVLFGDAPVMLPQVKAGNVKALGVTGTQRLKLIPELPTIAEAGLPGFSLVGWIGLFAPANTPQPIVSRLNAEVRKMLSDPEFASRLIDVGIEADPTTPEQLGEWVVSETARWSGIAKAAGIRPE
ncbi:MAG TPA: tripartite tricarboxylate transporter substrate binding protein [Microvirga sp.]|nr:tripartite tricarboxylate transporter substrate binding protein [Microvirga sp.]